MCTLYSQVKGQAEIHAIIDAIIDSVGNLPPQSAIFPDGVAPVVRDTARGRELVNMRWGFPPPEYTDERDAKTKKKTMTWFALNEKQPLFFFAGIWRKWTGTRGTKADPQRKAPSLFIPHCGPKQSSETDSLQGHADHG